MMEDYDEDDEHYCLKCHQTIIGLDNYVDHRKSSCRKTSQTLQENDTQQSLQRNMSDSLHETSLESVRELLDDALPSTADDFFHSLELQSSAKKSIAAAAVKSNGGIQTRSKTYATLTSNRDQEATTNIKEICYGNAGTFSTSKKDDLWTKEYETTFDTTKKDDLRSRDYEVPFGSTKKDDLRSRDYEVPFGSTKKDDLRSRDYDESDEYSDDSDYDDDDDDEDDEHPPRFHTGGKWKPSSLPVHWSENRDWSTPPINYTGGKWKPSTSGGKSHPPPGHTKGKWKPSSPLLVRDEHPPPSFTGSKWSSSKSLLNNVPPPEHTKGKWKPNECVDDEDNNKPLDSCAKQTKERNLPKIESQNTRSPIRKSNGRAQFWCGPCNRHLSSKIVYERHLKSDLHHKRMLKDRGDDFDDGLIDQMESAIPKRKPSTKVAHDGYENKDRKEATKTRIRQPIYVRCDVCRSRVRKLLMGKHLISHYHCRRSDLTSEESRKMVLEHIESIVHQSPFKCSPCSYYFNNHKDFLAHWCSDTHLITTNKYDGNFLCVFCKHESPTNDDMYKHLTSDEHQEVISVINRSVPIVIKRLDVIVCGTCNVSFNFNFELIRHCERTGHTLAITASDEYQNKFKCDQCVDGKLFRTTIALHRHQRIDHKRSVYVCRICDITFDNLHESKLHRRTCEHRYAVIKEKKRGIDNDEDAEKYKSLRKKCATCTEVFDNIIIYKKHVVEKHPDQAPTCPKCGAIFGIPQDLTVHTRQKKCSTTRNRGGKNRCDECDCFSTDSTSDYLFHKILHAGPIEILADDGKRAVLQYKCTICDKLFAKSSLRFHLRMHTKERPFECTRCDKRFARKTNFVMHTKLHGDKKHGERIDSGRRKIVRNRIRETSDGAKSFLCSTCGAKFKRQATLHRHMTIHNGKLYNCPENGCIYVGRNATDVKLHMVTHSDNRPYACDNCTYRGKTKNQLARHNKIHEKKQNYRCPHCPFTTRLSFHLKRHVRLHTGAKPYVCPHCNYKCNNLENLRKHILSTNIHAGKFIYECRYCENAPPFKCNFAKQFKVHLVTAHSNVFDTNATATAYITGIYDKNEETQPTQEPSKSEKYQKMPASSTTKAAETGKIFKKPRPSSERKSPIGTMISFGERPHEEQMFELLLGDNDDDSNCWNIVETSYDVVTFKSDDETLFQGAF